MNPSLVELSQIVGTIYDAVLDPSLWPHVLEATYKFVGGGSAALYAKDSTAETGSVFQVAGVDAAFQESYFSTYLPLDPTTIGLSFFQIGDVATTVDILPHDEFRQTRFYQEWAKPQKILDNITAIIEKSGSNVGLVTVMRYEDHGLADEVARQRMTLLSPHFRRAILIGNILKFNRLETATFAEALDGLASAMFLVEGRGRIVDANVSGHRLLATATPFRQSGGRLEAADPGADQILRQVFAAAGRGDDAVGTRGISIALSGCNEQPFVAHVLPLTSGARHQAGIVHAATAAIFVRKATLDVPAPMETIAKLYKLTPSELRVLAAIVEVGGPPAVASALGISEATVRTHLKRLFEKTETHRQLDLAKLVASYLSPLSS